jgi:hypothetical protein
MVWSDRKAIGDINTPSNLTLSKNSLNSPLLSHVHQPRAWRGGFFFGSIDNFFAAEDLFKVYIPFLQLLGGLTA